MTKFVVNGAIRATIASLAFIAAPTVMADDGKSVDPLASFEKTGDSKTCLRLSSVRDSDPLNDYLIIFEVRGGSIYVNELDGRCAGLERERRFGYRTPQAQICKGDIITVTDNFGNFRGSCGLGEFQELEKVGDGAVRTSD